MREHRAIGRLRRVAGAEDEQPRVAGLQRADEVGHRQPERADRRSGSRAALHRIDIGQRAERQPAQARPLPSRDTAGAKCPAWRP